MLQRDGEVDEEPMELHVNIDPKSSVGFLQISALLNILIFNYSLLSPVYRYV